MHACTVLLHAVINLCKLFSPGRVWVSEIPAGDGKIANIFLQCTEKKFQTEQNNNSVLEIFSVDFRSEAWLNPFWEHINGKLFAVQVELSYFHAEGSLRRP